MNSLYDKLKNLKPLKKLILICFIPVLLTWNQGIAAQVLNSGFSQYTKGDFEGAVSSFKKALVNPTRPSRSDTIKLLKFLGISLFMLGEREEARIVLKRALEFDPKLTILQEEVLDESVIDFLQSMKQAPPSNETLVASKDLNVPPSASTVRGGTSSIFIRSNAKQGDVLIDGLRVGSLNETIATSPGLIQVEIRANGFEPRKLPLSVQAQKKNVFEVVLKQIKSSNQEQLAKKTTPKKRKTKSTRTKQVILPPEEDLMFSEFEDESDLFSEKNRRKGRKSRTQRNDDLYIEDDIGFYDDYGASDIPMPSGNPPYYNDPRLNNNMQGYPNQMSPPAQNQWSPQQATTETSPVALLPFGAGQFYNGQYFLGSVFAIGQGAFLFLFYQEYMQELADTEQYEQVIKRESQTPTLAPEQLVEFRQKVDKKLKESQANQMNYLIGFGALWAGGILQSLFYKPDPVVPPGPQPYPAYPSYPYSQYRPQLRPDSKQISAKFQIQPDPKGLAVGFNLSF